MFKDKIEKSIKKTQKTTRINLNQPIKLVIWVIRLR